MSLNPQTLRIFLLHLMLNPQCPWSQIKAAKEKNKKLTCGLAKKFKLKYLGTVRNFSPKLHASSAFPQQILQQNHRRMSTIFGSNFHSASAAFSFIWLLNKKLDNFVPVQSANGNAQSRTFSPISRLIWSYLEVFRDFDLSLLKQVIVCKTMCPSMLLKRYLLLNFVLKGN